MFYFEYMKLFMDRHLIAVKVCNPNTMEIEDGSKVSVPKLCKVRVLFDNY